MDDVMRDIKDILTQRSKYHSILSIFLLNDMEMLILKAFVLDIKEKSIVHNHGKEMNINDAVGIAMGVLKGVRIWDEY